MFLQLGSDIQLHYQLIEGDASKPYLVFLHEGLGSIAQWKGFPEKVCEATGHPGLVYDRQGYGLSSALKKRRTVHYLHDYALKELANLLAGVLYNKDYILIGHSDGGSISLIAAAEQDKQLKGVITQAAHVFVEPETLEGISIAQQAWKAGKLQGLNKYHGEKTEQIFNAWAQTWEQPWFHCWNIEYLLASIDVPTLVMQGEQDQYGSYKQVESIAQTVSKGCSMMLANCGHIPHLEAPQATLKAMCNFINDVCAI
jgi:pimeloyl-ACP methyl ester carboxylesterase